jgi:hypothetical protein
MQTKYQKFQAQTINRSQIKGAAYNPRKIGVNEAKALRKSIKIHGLVDTLIYNKRTGNLVGGHQRLEQLDALEGTKDYELTLAVIDVPLKQEKEINIILNNPSVQGEYDFEAMKLLLPDVDLENTGFTDYDLSIMGVDEDVDSMEEDEEVQGTKNEMDDLKASTKDNSIGGGMSDAERIANIEAIKEAKAASRELNVSQGETYFVVTFSTIEAKESFLTLLEHGAEDRYVKGEILAKKLGFNI